MVNHKNLVKKNGSSLIGGGNGFSSSGPNSLDQNQNNVVECGGGPTNHHRFGEAVDKRFRIIEQKIRDYEVLGEKMDGIDEKLEQLLIKSDNGSKGKVPLNGDDTEAGCIKIPRSFLSSLGISKNDANPMYSLRERFFELKNANKEMQEKLQAFDYDRVYQLEYSLESSRMDLSLSEEQGRAYISRISELEEEVSVLRASSNSPSPQSENLAEKLRAQLTEQSRKRALENTQKELVESKKTVEELSQQVTMLQFQLAIHRAAGKKLPRRDY